MSDKNEVKKVFDFYAESEDGVVRTPFGEDVGDLKELFEVADFFAERYGLGGCRSLEEFVRMVDETDPVVLNMLKSVAVDKNQREMDEIDSKKPSKSSPPSPPPKIGKSPPSRPVARSRTPAVKVGGEDASVNRANMKRFLLSFGAQPRKLEAACGRLAGRKMELRDYSHIDSYILKNMSPEEFRKALRSISGDTKASENFEVSMETLMGKNRRRGDA